MKNDTLLVSRIILLGDREAFGRLVERYQSPIRRFLFHLTGDQESSKDLAQETFIKAWLKIGSFRSASKFSTWLYRIAYHTFYDHIRSRKPQLPLDRVMLEDIPKERNDDFNLDFAEALKILNENERSVMLLFFMEDQTVENISKITDTPPGTVKSHLSRGKKKLEHFFGTGAYKRD